MQNTIVTLLVIVLTVLLGYYFFINTPEVRTENSEEVVVNEMIVDPLIGLWRSADDERFTREFLSDGTVTDKYEGEDLATSVGVWSYVADVSAEPVELPETERQILKIVFGDETMYFAMFADDGKYDELELSYLNGNGILRFTRVTDIGDTNDTEEMVVEGEESI